MSECGKQLTAIVIVSGPSRTRVIGIVTTNRRRPSHIFVHGASRSPGVIAALVGIFRTRGVIALNFLDRVVARTRVDFSFVARVTPRVVIIVVCGITGGWATVARIVATILVVRHKEGLEEIKRRESKVRTFHRSLGVVDEDRKDQK
jgi:hypothetical protein